MAAPWPPEEFTETVAAPGGFITSVVRRRARRRVATIIMLLPRRAAPLTLTPRRRALWLDAGQGGSCRGA